jgi:Formin Homology 2 Domain
MSSSNVDNHVCQLKHCLKYTLMVLCATTLYHITHIHYIQIQGTIWEEIDRELGGDDSTPGNDQKLLNADAKLALISNFCATAPKKGGGADDEAKRKAEEEKKKKAAAQINLLDPKILQNVGITLAKFRMNNDEIMTAVLKMDESKLDLDKVCVCYA